MTQPTPSPDASPRTPEQPAAPATPEPKGAAKLELKAEQAEQPAAAPQAAPKPAQMPDHLTRKKAEAAEKDIDARIRALQAQERQLFAERKAIEKELRSQGLDHLATQLMGPVVPKEEPADAEPLLPADGLPANALPSSSAAAGLEGAQPQTSAGAQPGKTEGGTPQESASTESADIEPTGGEPAPLVSSKAQPTARQLKEAGPGVQKRDGKMLHPRFVSLFGHVLSVTAATYAVLCCVAGAAMLILFANLVVQAGLAIAHGGVTGNLEVTVVVFAVQGLLSFVVAGGLILLGTRMVLGHRHRRLRLCEASLAALTGVILCHLMVFGMTPTLAVYGLMAALLIALHSYWDPELALERANRRTETESLRQMIRGKDERTVVPGHRSGKGYITLNFFNLFWIFTICSVLGLVIETIFHFAVFHDYQDRAGMLWGPLSPIYGFGGTLMTIALNRFHNKPVWLIFLVSALIGGAFEFFTSWFMQTAFGVTAWNYSGTFLNIDGRTNFFFMCCWGLLGLVWVKLLLPVMLYFVKKIPWGWRYTLTTVCAILMIFDGAATLTTIDCWYLREAGVPVTTPIEQFCAVHYDDHYMENRFQTMTMNVSDTARTKSVA